MRHLIRRSIKKTRSCGVVAVAVSIEIKDIDLAKPLAYKVKSIVNDVDPFA
jgi:hypothetical protein